VRDGDFKLSTTREDAPKTRRSKKGKELEQGVKDAAFEMPFSRRHDGFTVEFPRNLLDRTEKTVEFYWSTSAPP